MENRAESTWKRCREADSVRGYYEEGDLIPPEMMEKVKLL